MDDFDIHDSAQWEDLNELPVTQEDAWAVIRYGTKTQHKGGKLRHNGG